MRNKYVNEDGTPFSKEEFLQKLKTDKEFNNEFGNKGIDQISELIRLLKENPDSRRMVVNAWNPSDLPNQVLPPCHYGFQVYTRELSTEERKEILYNKFRKGPIIVNGESYVECAPTDINFEFFNIPKRAISLMWNQRSVDTFLGLPFNIASYGLLLEIIAKETNMVPEELIGNLGDVHLYQNHLEQAREQIVREPYALPKLICKDEYWYLKDIDIPFTEKIKRFQPDFFKVEDYQSHLTIKAPLSN
jgi:thymidylate synthase